MATGRRLTRTNVVLVWPPEDPGWLGLVTLEADGLPTSFTPFLRTRAAETGALRRKRLAAGCIHREGDMAADEKVAAHVCRPLPPFIARQGEPTSDRVARNGVGITDRRCAVGSPLGDWWVPNELRCHGVSGVAMARQRDRGEAPYWKRWPAPVRFLDSHGFDFGTVKIVDKRQPIAVS
jgi:hypothetical protein